MISIFCLTLLLAYSVHGFTEYQVDIVLSGRDFPNSDPFDGAPEAYAIIFTKANSDSNTPFIKYGETAFYEDNSNPDWPEKFRFFVTDNSVQKIKIEVHDDDFAFHDKIGEIEFEAIDLITGDTVVEKYLTPDGTGKLIFKLTRTEVKDTDHNPKDN